MKKTVITFLAACLLFSATGCASSGKVLLSVREPIALASVVSNLDINWKDEDSTSPNSGGFLVKRVLQADPDMTLTTSADELINTAERIIREKLSGPAQITLAEKDTVLFSQAYRNAGINNIQVYRKDTKPEAYKFVNNRDKGFPPALVAETGIQRSMFVEFNFTKDMAKGLGKSGSLRADVEMKVLILDARGKTLYRKTFSVTSISTINVSYGAYSSTGIIELFEPTIADACDVFLSQLGN